MLLKLSSYKLLLSDIKPISLHVDTLQFSGFSLQDLWESDGNLIWADLENEDGMPYYDRLWDLLGRPPEVTVRTTEIPKRTPYVVTSPRAPLEVREVFVYETALKVVASGV